MTMDGTLASKLVGGLTTAGPDLSARRRVLDEVRSDAGREHAAHWIRLLDVDGDAIAFEGAAGALARARLAFSGTALFDAIAREAANLNVASNLTYRRGNLLHRSYPLRRVEMAKGVAVLAAHRNVLFALGVDDDPNLTRIEANGDVRWRVGLPPRVFSIAVGDEAVALGGGPNDGTVRVIDFDGRERLRFRSEDGLFAEVTWIDSQSLLVADGGVTRWQLATVPTPRWRIEPNADHRPVRRVALVGDEVCVVQVDDAGAARLDVHTLRTGELRRSIQLSHQFDPDEPFEGNLVVRPSLRPQLTWAPSLTEGDIVSFDLETGAEQWRTSGHRGGTTALVWVDDETLISAGIDGLIRRHQVQGGEGATLDPGLGSVGSLAHMEGEVLAAIDQTSQLTLWPARFETVRPRRSLRAKRMIVGRSPDELLVADNAALARWRPDEEEQTLGAPLAAGVRILTCSAEHIVVARYVNRSPRSFTDLEIRSRASGEATSRIEMRGQAKAILPRADGRFALLFNRRTDEPSLRLLDPRTGNVDSRETWAVASVSVAVGDDDYWVGGGWNGELERWQLIHESSRIVRFAGHDAPVAALTCAPSSWASLDRKGHLLVWPITVEPDLVSPTVTHIVDGATTLTSVGDTFVVGSEDGHLHAWTSDGTPQRRVRAHGHAITGLQPNDRGDRLASWARDGLRLWTMDFELVASWSFAGGLTDLRWLDNRVIAIDAAGFVHVLECGDEEHQAGT